MTGTDPQAVNWGDIEWSQWHDLDHARDTRLIPRTGGLYRFRAQDEHGLLYIGESGARWTRLDDLARARRRHPADYYLKGLGDPGHSSAPYFMLCEQAGCKIEVSWSSDEDPDKNHRKGAEARLLRIYRETTGEDPPVQHGGRGVAVYLNRRAQGRRNTLDVAAQKDPIAVRNDPDGVTRPITDESGKADALRDVLNALAATDPDLAERIARSITNDATSG